MPARNIEILFAAWTEFQRITPYRTLILHHFGWRAFVSTFICLSLTSLCRRQSFLELINIFRPVYASLWFFYVSINVTKEKHFVCFLVFIVAESRVLLTDSVYPRDSCTGVVGALRSSSKLYILFELTRWSAQRQIRSSLHHWNRRA